MGIVIFNQGIWGKVFFFEFRGFLYNDMLEIDSFLGFFGFDNSRFFVKLINLVECFILSIRFV